MTRPWWKRIFRQTEVDRQTERTLSEVRQALWKLDRALSTVDRLPERRQNPR